MRVQVRRTNKVSVKRLGNRAQLEGRKVGGKEGTGGERIVRGWEEALDRICTTLVV